MARSHIIPSLTIRVLGADDRPVVWRGLHSFLEPQDDPSASVVEAVEEANGGAKAVELVTQIMGGIADMRKLVERCPRSPIILTGLGEEDKVFPPFRAGTYGRLLEYISVNDLVQAMCTVCLGRTQLHPDVAQKLMTTVAVAGALLSADALIGPSMP